MRLMQVTIVCSVTLLLACTATKVDGEAAGDPADDTAAWWEENVDDKPDDSGDKPDDSGDKPDDSGDKPDDSGDKPDDTGIKADDCPDDFDPEAPCEGDWTTTLCMYDGLLWWCEEGEWLNEDDKI